MGIFKWISNIYNDLFYKKNRKGLVVVANLILQFLKPISTNTDVLYYLVNVGQF